jgi:hypothetical protein
VRTPSSVLRCGVLCCLTLGALLLAARPVSAEVTLFEKDGWSFFTDGRINTFLSFGAGDDIPKPTPNNNPRGINPMTGMEGPNPDHAVVGEGNQLFNAGFGSDQGFLGKYSAARLRSGFLGTVLAFGLKRQVSDTTTVKGYIGLWGTAESNARSRFSDGFGGNLPDAKNPARSFDVRYGFVSIEGPAGTFVGGRQDGILGNISTEINFLYGHNYGLGLPCVEPYFPTCGHIGTGALGPGNGAGFTYVTPSAGGLRLKAGLYDPVRLLGAWERVPYPRPEGALMFERRFSDKLMIKLQGEGMYQYMAQSGEDRTDKVWGVAGGGRLEAGPLRLGLAAFRGKGLGAYIALQNASSTFEPATREFRYFTGLYAQTALVFGREQISAGIGRVIADQLPADKNDYGKSNLKAQTGISGAFYHHVTDHLVLGVDYLYFHTDWWGARNSTNVFDADGNPTPMLLPGYLPAEKQTVHFLNAGATFHW